jgi:hypothetical protein
MRSKGSARKRLEEDRRYAYVRTLRERDLKKIEDMHTYAHARMTDDRRKMTVPHKKIWNT